MPFTQCLSLMRIAGGYGHFTDSKKFCCEGNLSESLSLMVDITPIQHNDDLSSTDHVIAWSGTNDSRNNDPITLFRPLMLSLPSNDDLKLLLTSFSTGLTNRYLVTWVIQNQDPSYYSVAKPFVWHRNESTGSVSKERLGDEARRQVNNI